MDFISQEAKITTTMASDTFIVDTKIYRHFGKVKIKKKSKRQIGIALIVATLNGNETTKAKRIMSVISKKDAIRFWILVFEASIKTLAYFKDVIYEQFQELYPQYEN